MYKTRLKKSKTRILVSLLGKYPVTFHDSAYYEAEDLDAKLLGHSITCYFRIFPFDFMNQISDHLVIYSTDSMLHITFFPDTGP